MMINDKKAYLIVLKQIECYKNRKNCKQECSSCSFSIDPLEACKALGYISEVLKARCPELYFAQTITELEEMLNAHSSKET